MEWRYKNVQFKVDSSAKDSYKLSGEDLEKLAKWLSDEWEVYHTVNINGQGGITSHVLFMLRREIKR
jgi:hypothetical protein